MTHTIIMPWKYNKSRYTHNLQYIEDYENHQDHLWSFNDCWQCTYPPVHLNDSSTFSERRFTRMFIIQLHSVTSEDMKQTMVMITQQLMKRRSNYLFTYTIIIQHPLPALNISACLINKCNRNYYCDTAYQLKSEINQTFLGNY